jgi:hypothetical protein
MHPSHFDEFFCAFDVHGAPDALASARREPNLVTDFIDAFPHSIDSAKGKRFIHRFGPGDARLSGISFVKADPLLAAPIVIFLEPLAQLGRCGKEKNIRHSVIVAQANGW